MQFYLILITLTWSPLVAFATGGFFENCNITSFSYEEVVVQAFPGVEKFNISAVLSGECLNSEGAYVNSSVDLGSCLENSNANLVWQTDGVFEYSCYDCALQLPDFCCTCLNADEYPKTDICIDLDTNVTDVNGQLEC